MDRGTCWSITINNATDADLKVELPAGWKVEGQMEVGENQTPHFQGMLKTPQVRFSAVKKIYPRAHIEKAKNAKALAKYVHKEDTRVSEVETRTSTIPTLWEYQTIIAKLWNREEFLDRVTKASEGTAAPDWGELAIKYVDILVGRDIDAEKRRGAEFIAINPMWRSSWKIFWRNIIDRDAPLQQTQPSPQADEAPPSAQDGDAE
nr:MAG: replication polyprotein [Owegonang virus 26]